MEKNNIDISVKKEKNKQAIFPFVMSILAFLCFALIILPFFSMAVQPLWLRIFVLLLPALILAGIGCCALKGKLTPRKTFWITLIVSILLFIVSVLYSIVLLVMTALTITTDTKYYPRAYDVIDHVPEVADTFPATVPNDAEDVEFWYNMQFLQGGEELVLSYTTTEEKIADWSAHLEEKADWVGFNWEWYKINDIGYYDKHPMSATRYNLIWDWGNHGEECYVLIELETNRITFCYEFW